MSDSLVSEEAEVSLQVDVSDESDHESDTDTAEDGENAPVRVVVKPDISHLLDAVQSVGGVPTLIVGVGARVVIDYSALKYGPWLDTRCWVVQSIGRAGDPGFIGLYDPMQKQQGCTNWMKAAKKGLIIKMAGQGDDFTSSSLSRKSARRAVARAMKQEHAKEEAEKKAANRLNVTADGVVAKSGRGRPKGTLNSKTVARLIAAGRDPQKLTRLQVDEIMAGIRKDEYEKAKAERKRIKEGTKACK